jgi:hypothetical protein
MCVPLIMRIELSDIWIKLYSLIKPILCYVDRSIRTKKKFNTENYDMIQYPYFKSTYQFCYRLSKPWNFP